MHFVSNLHLDCRQACIKRWYSQEKKAKKRYWWWWRNTERWRWG